MIKEIDDHCKMIFEASLIGFGFSIGVTLFLGFVLIVISIFETLHP